MKRPQSRPITVRFSETAWAFVEGEAAYFGVSTAQYIRESAFARALADRAQRHGMTWSQAIGWIAGEFRHHERDDLDDAVALVKAIAPDALNELLRRCDARAAHDERAREITSFIRAITELPPGDFVPHVNGDGPTENP